MPAKPNWKKTTFGYQGPEVGLHSVFAPAREVAREKCGGLSSLSPPATLWVFAKIKRRLLCMGLLYKLASLCDLEKVP